MYVMEICPEKRLASLTLRHRKGPFAPEILYVFFRERRGVRRQQDMTPNGVLSIRAQLKHCTEA
jgi:hypothetical protein